jgi:CheY-like chemotaxis protein
MAKILIVEDSPGGRGLVAALLRKQGHDILETANGVMALTATGRERPDLIVLDINMPVMDGFEFLERLRADPEIAGARVILHTSTSESAETLAKAASLGVSTILPKSALPAVILAAVNKELAADG